MLFQEYMKMRIRSIMILLAACLVLPLITPATSNAFTATKDLITFEVTIDCAPNIQQEENYYSNYPEKGYLLFAEKISHFNSRIAVSIKASLPSTITGTLTGDHLKYSGQNHYFSNGSKVENLYGQIVYGYFGDAKDESGNWILYPTYSKDYEFDVLNGTDAVGFEKTVTYSYDNGSSQWVDGTATIRINLWADPNNPLDPKGKGGPDDNSNTAFDGV